MVKDWFINSSRLATLAFLVAAAAFTGCSSSDTDEGFVCLADPTCVGCAVDGACCVNTNNCALGRICNLAVDARFDSTQPEGVCVQVTCDSDADCGEGEVCDRDRVCRTPICQTNDDCPNNELCLGGMCQAPPSSNEVASCTVVSPDTVLSDGASVTLAASAANEQNQSIGGVTFEWVSSAPEVVSVTGNVATGGSMQGTATLTARPADRDSNLDCEGSVTITNFPAVEVDTTRVVVVEDGAGSAVADAQVIIVTANGTQTATTGADGSATIAVPAAAVLSVTIEKEGYELLSVVQPRVDDIFIPLPKIPDTSVAGGFRGIVDLAQAGIGDIEAAFVGPAIPANVLDFGVEELVGDIVDTVIEAPDLMLDTVAPLPTGLLFGIGASTFTEVNERCLGRTPGTDELGCFLARAPAGPTAAWTLGGRLGISDLATIIPQVTPLLEGGTLTPTQTVTLIEDLLPEVIPLLGDLSHGINTSLTVTEFPKVNGEADFGRYQEKDMALTQGLNIRSTVTVPNLPRGQEGTCSGGAVMVAASNVEGLGLIPLGLAAALVNNEDPDCRVAGIDNPFGSNSEDLDDGEMPLYMATPHSGVEGSQTVLLAVALDIDQLIAANAVGFQLSAIINRVDRVDFETSVAGDFLAYPNAEVTRANGRINITSPTDGLTLTRLELTRDGKSWIIYAPAGASVELPDIPSGAEIVGAPDAASPEAILLNLKMRPDVTYPTIWQTGEGLGVDRLFDTVDAFVVSQCTSEGGSAPCTID